MGLFKKIQHAAEDVGTTVAKEVAKQSKAGAKKSYKKVLRPGYEKVVRPAASETYDNVLKPAYKDFMGWKDYVGTMALQGIDHPETALPFYAYLNPERQKALDKEYGLDQKPTEAVFTDKGRKKVKEAERGLERLPAWQRIALQESADPLNWMAAGAIARAGAAGGLSGAGKELFMQTGLPSLYKTVTAPTRIPGALARGRAMKLEVGIDAAAEAIKDASSIHFTDLSRAQRQKELAKLADMKDVAQQIIKGGKGVSKLDGQTYTAGQLRDVYDAWAHSESIVTGAGLDAADYLTRLRSNSALMDVHWMTNVAKEARTVIAHEDEDLSTVEKLAMHVPGMRNVLRTIAPAHYSNDPVMRTATQRLASMINARASNGVFETLVSTRARAAGMLRDPVRGIVRGVEPLGDMEPTVQNILANPNKFRLPEKVQDVVDAVRYSQRAVSRSIGEQALAFAEANPGIISKEDLKWYRLLAQGKDNYVHRKVAWATSVPEGAARYLEGTYQPNPLRRIAARMRLPVARIKGEALPPGFKAVDTTPNPRNIGIKPSITYERVVESASDAKNVLYSQDPGVILADYNNQLFQKFLDDTVYAPILKKMRIDPNALVNSKFDTDIGIATRAKATLGRLNVALRGVRNNKSISRKTISYLKSLTTRDDIPDELKLALEGDIVRAENLLEAMHARDVSAAEMSRRLRHAGELLEDLGDVKAFEAEALAGVQPEPERLSVWKKVADRIRRVGRRSQEIAEGFDGDPLPHRGTPVFHHTTATFSGLPTEGTGPLGRGAYVTTDPMRFASHSEGEGGRVFPMILEEGADIIDFSKPISKEHINRVAEVLTPENRKAFFKALGRKKNISGEQLQNAIWDALGIKRVGRGVTPDTGMAEFTELMRDAGFDAIAGGADQLTIVNSGKLHSMFETADQLPKAGMRRFYHVTSADSARAIRETGIDLSHTDDGLFWATARNKIDPEFGDTLVPIDLRDSDIVPLSELGVAGDLRDPQTAPAIVNEARRRGAKAILIDTYAGGRVKATPGMENLVVIDPEAAKVATKTADAGPSITDDLVASHNNLMSGIRTRIDEVENAFRATDDELRSLRADKAAAKDAATRGSWSMRHVQTPGLSGWYDEQVGESISQYFGATRQGDNILQQATFAQAIPQSMMAGADISVSFLQSAASIMSNPSGWFRALGYGLATFAGQGNRMYAGYLRGLARSVEATSGKSWLELAARGNLSMSGTELFNMSEYLNATGASGRRLHATAEFVANLPWNRAFSVQRNVAAMELYKAQVTLEQAFSKEVLTDNQLKSIARQVDLATGVVNTQKLGIGSTQSSVERIFGRFGAQWFRSQTGRLVQATRAGSMDGRVARRLLTQQVTAMMASYVAATTLAGQEPNLDPTSRDFLMLKVGKSRVRPGGILVSVARTFAQTAEAVANGDAERLAHIRQGDNPILNFWRNGAPVLGGLIADEMVGVNADASYRADEPGILDPQRYLPFSVQAGLNPDLQNPTLLDRFIAGSASAVGLSETPQSATDIWRAVTKQYALENGFQKWENIPVAQQEEITNMNAEIRDAKAALDAWYAKRGDSPLGTAIKQQEQSRRAMGDVLAGAWARVQSGQMSKSEWRQLYNEWSGKHAYLTGNVFDSLPEGEKKKMNKDKNLLQDKLAAAYQAIQPVDLNNDGIMDELDWRAWRETRQRFWIDNPEAQQYSDYIQFQYPVKVWEKLDNPIVKAADEERRRMSDIYDEFLTLPKYKGISKADGEFVDGVVSMKAAASRELGAMMVQRGVPPEKVRVPAALAWKYVMQQLNQSGMPATARNKQLVRLAVALDADSSRKLQMLSTARFNFLKQHREMIDWFPSSLRDTGLNNNMLIKLGLIKQPTGESVASRATALLEL